MTSIGPYLQGELFRRGLSPEEFGRRSRLGTSHIYQIIRNKKRPRQDTLDKIADGLGMTTGDLLRAAEAESSDDPIEQAIRQRTAEMREAVEGTPREFWGTIIKATFDRAIDSARDMASLLAQHGTDDPAPVTEPEIGPVTSPESSTNRGEPDSHGRLPLRQRPPRLVIAGAAA